MSSNEEKRKSLFQLFHKPAPTKAEPQFSTETIATDTDVLVEERTEQPAAYGYVASWQKAADNEQDEAQREVVVNAAGMTTRLDEIFKAPNTPNEFPDTSEPRCLSATAAERFTAALSPEVASTSSPVIQTVPTTIAKSCFSDRLKQHVETSLQQPLLATAVVAGETK